ncbi:MULTISPECIES: HlyD family secretion protein [Microbaculum]|uniref:HlyD family efflux transporter periplasmic adaptor subunit n=1 Tax=Microbaculum marinisediminis TaxID=2931392 RepID=A0AAW5QW01_9HYPH|nr:HlyD family efflux transporter periplasmic adaptor subunit [Microbaculum sp. A6E488]MCT8970489.1 HlyD family efflux transporter periplasmic adaptor subunit [Microbaculum sp. A6E488]
MRPLRLPVLLLVAVGLSGCFWQEKSDVLQGYVEGDFLDVGAEETGRLVALDVRRGDAVTAGAELFRIDDTDARAARAEAEARLAQAKAQLADLEKGRRKEELDVLQAQHDEIEASLEYARREYQRYRTLHEASVVSDANAENAEERLKTLQSRLASMAAQIDVAKLAARPDAIKAAQDAVDAASQAVARIDARIARLTGAAPMAGSVQDTYYEPGEVVPAGRAVVSVLPPENLKVRFFVPQDRLAEAALGGAVSVSCDGCAAPIPAKITFISDSAEFTPPVIYSVHARQKLVYMVEAHPDDTAGLNVGQPVDVRFAP